MFRVQHFFLENRFLGLNFFPDFKTQIGQQHFSRFLGPKSKKNFIIWLTLCLTSSWSNTLDETHRGKIGVHNIFVNQELR